MDVDRATATQEEEDPVPLIELFPTYNQAGNRSIAM
jgi:hypothetical protein